MRIAIIPARGGSKRIPRKNIIDFFNKPMIAHVISELRDTKLFNIIHVSTDDEEIAEISRNHGASVDFLRDPLLATDTTPVVPVIRWVLNEYLKQGLNFKTCLMVMPCSPLLNQTDFTDSCKKFEQSNQIIPMLAVAKFPSPIEWALLEKDGLLVSNEPEKIQIRSQDLEKYYFDAGLFAYFHPSHLMSTKEESFSTFQKYEIPRWKAIDIDNWDDLELAQKFMVLK